MLFDLRGRGRRTTVRIIYAGLAVLFGSGLVLFGVGGFGGTGILTSLSQEKGSGGGSFASQVSKYRKLTAKNPSDESAWENLAKALYHEAGREPYTTSAGAVTSKGKEVFRQVADAWEKYIALDPPKPNAELAQLMVGVFSEEGLNQPASAVAALQIVIPTRPSSAALYGLLAQYAYKAHNSRQGDLASQKALSLTPKSERAKVKKVLDEAKKAASSSGTATIGGKTYNLPSSATSTINSQLAKAKSKSAKKH
jgi:hypothetical protein